MAAFIKAIVPALFAWTVSAQKPQFPPAFPPTPALPSSINYAPSVTPNVLDTTAPNAQAECPGYRAFNIKETQNSLTANLILAGEACDLYGYDIHELTLDVVYQAKERLSVKIYPRYLGSNNESLYTLSPDLTPQPSAEEGSNKGGSDLVFTWSNEPSFQFRVSRAGSGEVLFDTFGKKIVYEDQFLELVTSMVPDYNIYGLAESLRAFRLPNNFTQTFWNAYNLDNDNILDVNGHSTHPVYLETRYGNGTSKSHGVYARNAHGQDWLLRPDSITYRTIGGSFEFYFLSGSKPKDVISQYQTGVITTPYLPAYWHLGFQQNRWGYLNWTNLQDVIDAYADAGIQLEAITNDLDYLNLNRIFTHKDPQYNVEEGQRFLARLHASGQYYLPILDPNVYAPAPENQTDVYPPYDRGVELDVYIRSGANTSEYYYGVLWNGFSAYPDFMSPATQQFWTEQFVEYHKQLAYDGWWLDVSDATSFCTGSCGTDMLDENPIHVPFPLPGDPNTSVAVDYRYPEAFNLTNATEAASASASFASQSSAYPTPTATPTPVLARTFPTPGVRNLTFPPYAINNFLAGHSLVKQVLSPDAVHKNGMTEYELHNLYGHTSANASYHALLQAIPGKRPWIQSRATFAGTGNFSGHWGGDTNSKWGNMYFGISQALQFAIAGIPYFGVETCGFNGNADMQLCTRWMQLSAWFPLYRNHNNRNTIPQEAYRWSTTAEATRRIMDIRYSLLPYTYTLFHKANTAGETVLRALAWEFPDEEVLKAVETQFMSGPSILVTPVLEALATTVKGVFPGVGSGTIWYDWYSLQKVEAATGENKTLQAPLVHQPIHVRGGSIIPMQKAGNTTKTSRMMPWSLLVALDKNGEAQGELYLDDGVSVHPNETKNVELLFSRGTLSTKVSGDYNDGLPLANITIAGAHDSQHSGWSGHHGGKPCNTRGTKMMYAEGGVVYITNLGESTRDGIWSGDFEMRLH
ncbi:alpha-glucosidase precursor [Hortaea werneckii]|nr:alpha-glucosidase precursor [Hortaea werneckii]KAI7571407.1 alpha-glucosidase precursor [Hortaea werneckii]KAI7613827.1 alpha-glucosidase precursor [Hortaea werneckii]KAI7625503.1 alpha-glucosidase precursor [Hortaea werneckii]KAI7656821.1 alpha-glucosidase precursor [Hortaea werneckii]